jgi:hypothetical protein
VIPRADDEAPHTPGAQPRWSEVWHLDAASGDGVGLTVRLECFPNRRQAWFWTYLAEPERPGPIVVRDHEVTPPRQGLEVRAEGLWAELWCETPLEHWTYGLEAFAVALDEPADALAGEIGDRIAIGLDLEWEIDGEVHARPDDWPRAAYVAPGIVHGDLLLGRERFEFDGRGLHRRSWGDHDDVLREAWSFGCTASGTVIDVEALDDGRVDGFRRVNGETPVAVFAASREGDRGAERFVLDGEVEVDADVVVGAPVPVDASTVIDRAFCRFGVADATAYGWSSAVRTR